MLTILNVNETFTPRYVPADLLDINFKSVRVVAQGLSRSDCEQLLETRLMAKIRLGASFLVQPLTLKADIFWARYVEPTNGKPPYADLGFHLRPPKELEQVALKLVIQKLSEKKASEPQPPPDPELDVPME